MEKVGESFSELIGIMARLRGDQGCPWDKKQTHLSLKPALLEEAYELLEAIDGGDPEALQDELADLLHQVIFHCQIAREKGQFSIEEILARLKDKMVRRHPHVFSERALPDSEAVLRQRAEIKAKEMGPAAGSMGTLPKSMPALARAQRITERASHLGFDWPGPEQVWGKIEEELGELRSVLPSHDNSRFGEEMGDLLFSLVNLCRFFHIEAEETLAQTTNRFLKRFAHIEATLHKGGKSLADASLAEMDALWEEAKRLERRERP